jgi:hypothetical protein
MFAKKSLPFLILLTSSGTLICCALPALFVALGAGATLAGVLSAVPQLIWLSEHKVALFIFSGFMLAFGGLMQWRAAREPCPIDPVLRQSCSTTRRWSLGVYLASLGVYFVGFFFAYLINLF